MSPQTAPIVEQALRNLGQAVAATLGGAVSLSLNIELFCEDGEGTTYARWEMLGPVLYEVTDSGRTEVPAVPVTLRAQIRALRRRLDLTQAAFAEKLGVGHRTVSGWERNVGAPGAEMLAALQRLGLVVPSKNMVPRG